MGENVTLECSDAGGPDNMYYWLVNGSCIIGEMSLQLQLFDVQASNGGEYTCVVSNAGSDSARTFLYVTPYIVTHPMDTLTSNGSLVQLSCEALSFPSPVYRWRRTNGEPIRAGIDITTQTLTIDPVMFGDEGSYFCSISSRDVTINSSDATITGIVNLALSNSLTALS